MSAANSTIRSITYNVIAAILSKPLGFAQSFLLAMILGPTDFGVLATLMLVVAYGPLFYFGVLETLIKMVPYHRGRGDIFQIKETEGSVLGSIILASLLVLILAVAAPLSQRKW